MGNLLQLSFLPSLPPFLTQRDYFSSQCSALVKCLEEKKSTQLPSQSALQTLADENRYTPLSSLPSISFQLWLITYLPRSSPQTIKATTG